MLTALSSETWSEAASYSETTGLGIPKAPDVAEEIPDHVKKIIEKNTPK